MSADSQTPAWDEIEKQEGWNKVPLADVVGEISSPESIARVLRRKGYQELSNGKWHDVESRTVIDGVPTIEEQQKDQEADSRFAENFSSISASKSFKKNL